MIEIIGSENEIVNRLKDTNLLSDTMIANLIEYKTCFGKIIAKVEYSEEAVIVYFTDGKFYLFRK